MRANPDGTKWCSKCKTTKLVADFGPNKKQRDGLANWCRVCKAADTRRLLQDEAYRERQRIRHRERYQSNLEVERARSRSRYHENKEKDQARHRRERLRSRFGMTVEQFEQMFTDQGGRCAICGTDDFQGKRPHVDHCHTTGVIRGLLCVRCNQGLGNFRDSPAQLRAAIAYLERTAVPVDVYKSVRDMGRKRAA